MGNICAPPSSQEPVSKKKPDPRKAEIASSKLATDTQKPSIYKPKPDWTYDSKVTELIKEQIKNKIFTEEPDLQIEKIAYLFDRLDKWEFPILDLEALTDKNPLVYLMYAIFVQYDAFKRFNLEETKVLNFLTKLQSLYGNNPFTNSTFAAQTAHTFHYVLRRGLNQYLSDEDTFACFLAAASIGLGHPGLDNEFQANYESAASTLYNDLNILENHAATSLFELIREFKLFETFSKEQQPELRELIIEMILSSDLKDYDQYSEAFKSKVQASCEFSNREDIKNIVQVTLILSKFSHVMKGSKLYREFTTRDLTERFNQGDLEQSLGFPQNQQNNRVAISQLGQIQIDTIDKYVKPLLKVFTEVLPKLKFFLPALRRNYKYWSSPEAEIVEIFRISVLQRIDMLPSQEAFDNLIRARPFPDDQDKNVPPSEQEALKPNPSESELELERNCMTECETYFGGPRAACSSPLIYSLSDFKLYPLNELSNEVRKTSVMAVIERIDNWNFDVFVLSKLLGNHAMLLTAWALFQRHNLFNEFKVPEDVFTSFFREVQVGYQMNPYHNAMHACDVMQITHSIIVNGKMLEKMSSLDAMAAILSSAVHDLDHPGLNNAYQVHANSYLTTIYNDRSVLENHHCAQTFQIIRKDEKYNIFKNMTKEQQRDARLTMVGMIISTDMTNHGKYVKLFNSRIEAGSDFKKKDDIRIALQIAIKMADVSNPSRPLYLYLQWTDKIMVEFFKQGDMERENGYPVSPLMDRQTAVLSKGQIAFMQYVILPMFSSFATVFPGMKFALKHIETNKAYWESHSEIDEKDYIPTNKDKYCLSKEKLD